ncbi:MAG: YybH family protein [Bdellovibrionales bacterium]
MSKTLKAIILILTFSNIALAHQKATPKEVSFFNGDKSLPGKVVKKFHIALKNKNKKKALKQLDESVLIYEGGGVERSAQEYASHHLMSDMAFMSKMKVNLVEHQVEVFDDIAVSSSRSEIEGEYNEKKIKKTTMETIVLKKRKNKWKIIRIHWS